MEGDDDVLAGKRSKDKQHLLSDGAVPSDGPMMSEPLHTISLEATPRTEIPQSIESAPERNASEKHEISILPSTGVGKAVQMTPLTRELEEEDDHEGPLLDPKTQPVNKLPKQEEEFDSYLTGWVRTLVIAVTSGLTLGLLGSTVVLAVCLMPGLEGTIDTIAPTAAALLMLSLMGSLIWCCWLGWNQCWFAASKDNLIRRLPFTRLHMLKPDALVKVKGRIAVGPDGPLTASYSHQMNCVYTEAYLYKQEKESGGQETGTWTCDVAERQAVDFFVVDDATGGSVLVKAGYGAGITTIVPVKEVVETVRGSTKLQNKTPKLEKWLEDRDKTSYVDGESDLELRRQEWLRFTESYLRAGDAVLVVGQAERKGTRSSLPRQTRPFHTVASFGFSASCHSICEGSSSPTTVE